MAWSIIIMTDLVCEEVLSVLTHVSRYEKRVATIRKLTLCMCCKNRRLITCRAGATAVALQAVSERRLRKFHFPPFSILRLAQDVKVQGFSYRSLRPAEILVASKEC